MTTETDAGRGQAVGSHIRMKGSAFGMTIELDEVVIEHERPRLKSWQTVGDPKLVVIGNYRISVTLEPSADGTGVRIRIDYDLPRVAWLGRLFGRTYAKWCIDQMLKGVTKQFP